MDENPKLDIQVPPPLVESLLQVIQTINPQHPDIHVIVIAAQTGCAPTLTGTMHPDSMHDLFQWLIDHRDRSAIEVHDLNNPDSHPSVQ
jgi:hypothetical protein